jgi:hypothetical protein
MRLVSLWKGVKSTLPMQYVLVLLMTFTLHLSSIGIMNCMAFLDTEFATYGSIQEPKQY